MRKWGDGEEVQDLTTRERPLGPRPLLLWIGVGLLLLALGSFGLWPRGEGQGQEEEAVLRVEGVIVDAETGLPVDADVYLDGRLLYTNVRSFAVEVPSGSELRVIALGYQPWAFRFRYRLKGAYRFHGPVRLVRAPVSKASEDEHGAKKVLDSK